MRTEAEKAKRKAYRAEHKEDFVAKEAAYYAANKEERAAYRAAHKAQIAAKDAAYRASHKDKRATWNATYSATHRGDRSVYNATYHKANPEKSRAADNRRRARKQGAEGSYTEGDIKAQYTRQKGKCFWCGKRVGKDYHVDHVVPLSRGGSNWPENLVISCATCNLQKRDKMPHEWAQGGRLL